MLNVTAIFTLDQVRAVADALDPKTGAIVSVSPAIADTGVDPMPHMRACKQISRRGPRPSCCGPARANCSTSSRPTRPAARSSRCRTNS